MGITTFAVVAVHWLMTVLALVAVSVVWCFMALALFVMSVFGAVLVVISMLLSGGKTCIMDIVMLDTMTSALLDVMIELVELVFNIVLESLSVMEVNIVAISITLVRSV